MQAVWRGFNPKYMCCSKTHHTTCGPTLETGVLYFLKAKWDSGTNQQLLRNAQLFPFPEISGNHILFLWICVCTTLVRLVSVNIVQYVESLKIKCIISVSFNVCCSQPASVSFPISLQISEWQLDCLTVSCLMFPFQVTQRQRWEEYQCLPQLTDEVTVGKGSGPVWPVNWA